MFVSSRRGLVPVVSILLVLILGTIAPVSQAVSPPDWAHLLVSQGPVADAKCNMEVIQTANNQRLHSLLEEITNTTYFRLFGFTNTMDGCPLNKEEEACPTAGAQPGFSSLLPFAQSSTEKGDEKKAAPGGGGLCGVEFAQEASPFGSGGPAASPFGTPKSKQEGPSDSSSDRVSPSVNMTISSREDNALTVSGAKNLKDCDDTTKPQFWLDMCEKLAPHSTDFVNLQLNPEGFTGYNGTEVWNAVYEQNCFSKEKGDEVVDMCYEERVMYRLLSGMHASTNIHISENFKQPIPGIRDSWESNPDRFMKQFAPHPERIRNLHFSFVVMLRALYRAAPALYHYRYETGVGNEDDKTQKLIQQLLDSDVLRSCNDVFTAFDESMLFRTEDRKTSTISALKREFKRVFHNISNLINCVTCTKCKLHGRMQLLGIGTALKILLIPPELVSSSLERNEIVALVNTIHKFSHAIATAPKLMEMYWEQHLGTPKPEAIIATFESELKPLSSKRPVSLADDDEALDLTVGSIARAAKKGLLSDTEEIELLDLALVDERDLLVLGKHYSDDLSKFVQHALRNLAHNAQSNQPDVVIVGGGLGGLSAALAILDRGGQVVLVEKEGIFGGNSAKASSGINGIDEQGKALGDSVASFAADIVRGSGIPEYATNPLVTVLAEGSEQALAWLRSRVGIPLELRGQLGGHSFPRTHRPADGMAGSELVAAVKAKVMEYARGDKPALQVKLNTRAVELLRDELDGAVQVVGVKAEAAGGEVVEVRAASVILATGGFANDFSDSSLIARHRPEYLDYATTNGRFATGDGHKLAEALGAGTVDMGNIQLHPTGFVDRKDKDAKVKTLCAEILRGVGAILVDSTGKRFANELGTRDYISNTMLANAKKNSVEGQPSFGIILNEEAAGKATKHLSTYTRRSLLNEVVGLKGVADYLGVPLSALELTISEYNGNKEGKKDPFGKVVFPSMPFADLSKANQLFYVGEVTPVMHYTMGGITIDEAGRVLSADPSHSPIPGLFAAGEVTGGIHGKNRLGGNALTECVVFGYEVGTLVPVSKHGRRSASGSKVESQEKKGPKKVGKEELAQHSSADSCWVVVSGQVYDFTEFAPSHPGGAESIHELCGLDGTKVFFEVHSAALLDDFQPLGTFN